MMPPRPAPCQEHAIPAGKTESRTASAIDPRSRPSWCGLLRISLVAFPVKAYPAVSSTSASQFHLLHAGCGQRIQYQKTCSEHGAVPGDEIVKGYEYARGQYVVVDPEERERLRPLRDKALVLEQFVPVTDVDPVFFAGRDLFLLPDGAAAQHPYGVLLEVMQQDGLGALGRVVVSNQRQLMFVRPTRGLLMAHVLYYPAQVRPAAVRGAKVAACATSRVECELTRQLLLGLASGPLDWTRYRDTSAEDLAAWIEAKVAKETLSAPGDQPAAVLRLHDTLEQSIVSARPGSAPNDALHGDGQRAAG
jgi:DNA end-binding protein Ku